MKSDLINGIYTNVGTSDWDRLADDCLLFVKWSDAEPVNIDLALAQIAEMESAEKTMTHLDYLNKNLTKLAEMLIFEIETGDPYMRPAGL